MRAPSEILNSDISDVSIESCIATEKNKQMYLVLSGRADSYLLLITLWQLSLYSLGIVVRSNLKITLMIIIIYLISIR